MKILLLVTGGRGGSDFFQGLLDGHDQILQFPGTLRINHEFLKIFDSKSFNEISEKFINYAPIFFDSRKNKIERHDRLGKNRNEYYTVDKKKFKFFFNKLAIKENKYNRLSLLKNLHKAYYLARNKKINKAKILFIHTHIVELTKKFLKFEKIKNFSIIHTMRYPINALISPINNWLNYQDGKFFFPKDLYFQYDLVFNGLSDLTKISQHTYVVLLENLIKNKSKVMKDFCRIYKIKFSKNLLNCTYFGKQWWGDKVSGRWLGKSIKLKEKKYDIKLNLFFDRDLTYFYTLFKDLIKKYFKKEYKYMPKKVRYFSFLPTKPEILVWKNSFKHRRTKHILSIPYYYLKRIIFLNNFFVKNYKFPYSIGSRKI
jgi:hypothetical protein|tara:strand:+ start:1802 stop:2914 length:1113 start_codon:yes stop_codon:yes gene_type:complete